MSLNCEGNLIFCFVPFHQKRSKSVKFVAFYFDGTKNIVRVQNRLKRPKCWLTLNFVCRVKAAQEAPRKTKAQHSFVSPSN